MLRAYILSRAYQWLTRISQLSLIFYMGLCISAYISIVMVVKKCILHLIIITSETWIISHCLGLGHETMVRTLCLIMSLSMTFAAQSQVFAWVDIVIRQPERCCQRYLLRLLSDVAHFV